MAVTVNKRLNLVIPVELDEKTTLHVHSTPILEETFDRYYEVLGKAFNRIHTGGLGIAAGSRVAELLVRDIATQNGTWEGPDGVQNGLINDIIRLTNVMAPGDKGWQMVPLDEAIRAGTLDRDDAKAVRSAIVFFTLISWVLLKRDLPAVMVLVLQNWGGQLTPLNATEFLSSLPISTGTADSLTPPA